MVKNEQAPIHRWDGATVLRSLLWAVAVELAALKLWEFGGGMPLAGFGDNPLVIIPLLMHLPMLLIADWLGLSKGLFFGLQTTMIAYSLFVWFRRRKIRKGLK